MKKLICSVLLLLVILVTAGCSKKNYEIKTEEITTDTILAKPDGTLQVATVEDFDKPYYKLGELQEFIAEEVKAFNDKVGSEAIIVDEVQVRDGKAIMLLTYSGMEPYASFNEVTAAYFNGGVTDIPLTLPATLVSTKNDSYADTNEVLANTKLKVLVMNEPYDILVQGDIKYYSDNAELLDDNKVRGAEEGYTVVAYKP